LEYKWTVLTVTTVGIFMSTLDASIVVVGLPTIIQDLNTSLFAGIWVITGYRLMITILLVTVGRVADIIGRVKLYNAGFAVFTAGSLFCSLAPSGELLIAARLVQGLGGALLFVNSMAIVVDAFPTAELGTAIGINQMAINAGTIVGYTLSGVMIGLFGWRSIFWINIPIGIFGTIWAHRRLKELYGKTTEERFDYLGALLFSSALTIVLLALTIGDLQSLVTRFLLITSMALFAIFLVHERRVAQPVLDLWLFRIRPFIAGNLSNLFNGLAFAALAFELTLYFELVKGYTDLQTGLALIPMDLTLIVIGPISGRLSDRYGGRGLSTLGLAITSGALLVFSTFSTDTTVISIAAALALAGFGIGLFRSPNASSVMASVPADRRGIGAGVRSTILNTSSVVSIPLALALMTAVMPYDKLAIVVSATSMGSQQETLQLLDAIRYAFYAFAVINALGVIVSFLRGPRRTDTDAFSSGAGAPAALRADVASFLVNDLCRALRAKFHLFANA
jgi:EmrB/QacA subfamily drug resistance transporter